MQPKTWLWVKGVLLPNIKRLLKNKKISYFGINKEAFGRYEKSEIGAMILKKWV
jgi:hypothetical protein